MKFEDLSSNVKSSYQRKKYIEIPTDVVKPDSTQPRKSFSEESLKNLAETYRTHGVIQHIEIDENYKIITGERRWRAAKIAGLKTIPCVVIGGLSEEEKLERRLIENIHHEPLTDLEKGEAIKKLIELKGWSVPRAARVLGVDEDVIRRVLSLIEAPKELRKLVKEGKISPSDAGEISYKLRDKPTEAVEVAKKVAKARNNKRKLVREEVKRIKLKERVKPIPEGIYNLIYADPPWEYDFSIDTARSIPMHYPVMKLEDICNLKIPAAEDSILFLWATPPKLREALKVIEAWGFNYKTSFVWVKDKIGMGYYCRNQHELLLVATRGNVSPPAESDRYSSVIYSTRTRHSEKPDIVYEMIEKMYPDYKYLELFARSKRRNWTGWGLEYEK